MRRLAPLLLVLVAACDEETLVPARVRPTAAAPTDDELGATPVAIAEDDGFLYAHGVTVLEAHAPTRFEARLPSANDRFAADGSVGELPYAYLESRLCNNDAAMRRRVVEALERISAQEPVDQDVVDTYLNLVSRCPSMKNCAWLAEQAHADRPYWVRVPLASATVYCDNPVVGELLMRGDAPPRAAVIWHRNHVDPSGAGLPLELERAVKQLMIDQHVDAFSDATVALARYPGTEATRLLAELQAMEDRLVTDESDAYGYGGEAPSLLGRACEYLLLAPQCPDAEVSDVDLVVNGSQPQYEQALLDPKRAAKANLWLTSCIHDYEQAEPRRQLCLARLAARDWAQAKDVTAGVTAADPAFGESLRIVASYDSHVAFRRELADLGLIGDHAQPTFQETLAVSDELYRAHRLYTFGGRSSTIPVRHDALLFQLAGLAGDTMVDVVFEELVPAADDELYDTRPYVLRAYADGKRWSVTVDVIDDLYDVKQTIGLLNVVAAERGSELRWVALRDDMQYAVIVAPRDGIRRAVDRGLIELAEL